MTKTKSDSARKEFDMQWDLFRGNKEMWYEFIQDNYISKDQIRKHFETLSGGGNARRLLTQLLDE